MLAQGSKLAAVTSASRPIALTSRLLFVHEMPAPVLLPTILVRFGAERFFLAIADCLDAAGADARLDERVLHGVGAIGSEREVVLGGAALVAVSFDGYVEICMLLQELRIALNGRLLVAADIGLVIIEVDILD